jgi:hypothetical protein
VYRGQQENFSYLVVKVSKITTTEELLKASARQRMREQAVTSEALKENLSRR